MAPKRTRKAIVKQTPSSASRDSSKVTKPAAEKATSSKATSKASKASKVSSKASSKKSTEMAGKTTPPKKGKEPARSRSLTPEEPMNLESATNPRWPADKKDYAKFVDYSVLSAYANGADVVRPTRGKKNPRWTHHGDEPLTDPAELPEGWSPNELDLFEEEIDAQIERCHERIDDNIFPHMFQQRLDMYLEKRKQRDDMIAAWPDGIDWETVQRLHSLKGMEDFFTENGDEDGQLANVRAIINAYKNKEIMFVRGMMSYWSKGEQVGAPEPWDHTRHEAITAQYGSHREFWVEGFFGATPMPQMKYAIYNQHKAYPIHSVLTDLRSAGAGDNCLRYSTDLLYDTGASVMSIAQVDVDWMVFLSGIEPPTVGFLDMSTANGIVRRRVVEIEVTIRDPLGDVMCPYMKVLSTVDPNPNNQARLTGPWMRFVLFTGTSPMGTHVTLADQKQELVQSLPDWNFTRTFS
ncbi:uncharacterized protein N7511_009646 [Penicillium nucicola]|uniref:uncharacterized protein n=1 Tax=Penicillium nucicola TaxID=1850975 RepID=UPI0025452259|nr:uncharacterized protein N7511_009646 [Penicillium nucicola]KAJ5747950.1 hypothetical protein N7511_009646 [Penicillium nucicola]